MTTIIIDDVRYETAAGSLTGLQLRALPFCPVGGEASFYYDDPSGGPLLVSNDDQLLIEDGYRFFSVYRAKEAQRLAALLDALDVTIEPDPDEPTQSLLKSRYGYLLRRSELEGDWFTVEGGAR